jgi:gamma-tubulin complex component 3
MLSRKIAGISIIRNKWAILSLLDSVRDSTSDVPFSSLSISSTSSEKIPENVIRAPESAKPASELLSSNKSKRKFDWSLTHWRVSEETNFRDSEQIILRDMIFALQGIDGKYIKYSEEYSKYLVSDSVSIPPPTIKFIEKICEGGALYRRVKSCLSLSTSQGRVRQSFSEVVRKLLADYFRLLAVLESQIIQTSLSSSSSSSKTKKNNDDKENNALTLRRLHVWLIDPLERLRVLADLCESTRAAEGGALASATFLHVQHGDETVRSLVRDVMSAISLPLFQIMYVLLSLSLSLFFFLSLHPPTNTHTQVQMGYWWCTG